MFRADSSSLVASRRPHVAQPVGRREGEREGRIKTEGNEGDEDQVKKERLGEEGEGREFIKRGREGRMENKH